MLDVNLSRLAGGELQEKFNREVTKVVQNMQDPNTPSGKERSITIRLSFKQTEFRDDAKIEISVSSKLASGITTKTNFAMGRDLETGVNTRPYRDAAHCLAPYGLLSLLY